MPIPVQDAPTISSDHVKEFVRRYDLLLFWCLRLTRGHREEAEDLLHDTFLHFTQTRPDLTWIENLDAFLRTVVRNFTDLKKGASPSEKNRTSTSRTSLRGGHMPESEWTRAGTRPR